MIEDKIRNKIEVYESKSQMIYEIAKRNGWDFKKCELTKSIEIDPRNQGGDNE